VVKLGADPDPQKVKQQNTSLKPLKAQANKGLILLTFLLS